ncbi:hypothetical protein SAY87_012666 [Trapa incisa]|uniref:Cytochrome b561 and DOMON domain-containing protein n=1 Tax=Trapa incisa TaxID=236973 RepID=A0AAN7GY48_9MYRT|nr:hypothetical protein SAY87_012666 [Trapa incisa]
MGGRITTGALAISASNWVVVVMLLLTLPRPSEGYGDGGRGHCSTAFRMAAIGRNITHCRLLRRVVQIQLGWETSRFNSQWTQIDVMFSAQLRSDIGWLAWGVNPLPQPQMVGTRAIIGIRLPNGSQSVGTYNVTSDTKKGCQLLPSTLDIEVPHKTLDYDQREDTFVISAKVVVPNSKYNISRLNHVWEVGYEAVGVEPKMHPKVLQDFNSAEALNFLTDEEEDAAYKNHQAYLRKVHGILNIVGWGTVLPVGVIIARYWRGHSSCFKDWWYYSHISCQIAGYSIGTAGWTTGLILGHQSRYFTFHIHRLLAIVIFTFTTLQILALRLKPDVNDEYRKYWNMYHSILGCGLLAVIILNIFHGIKILKPDNAVWRWVYIGILVGLSTVALPLEGYTWFKFKRSNDKGRDPKTNDWRSVPVVG